VRGLTAARSSEEDMKEYEVITRTTMEWSYVVKAESPEEAERKLQKALDSEESDYEGELYDRGTEEVLEGKTSLLT
jgi:hypothetical protein